MGKGKGSVDHWAAVVKRERILLEISGVEDEQLAKEILKSAIYKLPMRVKIVKLSPAESEKQ
jgi:large subunit ribosomal protein L16